MQVTRFDHFLIRVFTTQVRRFDHFLIRSDIIILTKEVITIDTYTSYYTSKIRIMLVLKHPLYHVCS